VSTSSRPSASSAEQPRVAGGLDVAFLTDGTEHCELVLVRHGQQEMRIDPHVTPIGTIVDPPLSAIGRRQAELVGERFAGQRVDAVYASNLQRAHDTGAAIAGHHGLDVHIDRDLREIEVYRDLDPERPLLEQIGRDRLAGVRERMIRDRSWDVYPHSESGAEFLHRTVTAIEAIAATNPGRRVVVACHGGVINSYVGWILGLAHDMFFRPGHTSINIVRAAAGGRRALFGLGDVAHLERAEGLVTY
jgi:2,3-bisphosphoglycerate-dependent phosphoglycerate mutase